MRSRRLTVLGLVLLLAAALPGAVSASARPGSPHEMSQGPIHLEAVTDAEGYAPGQLVTVAVTATNTGREPLSYWLPTPCASPFRVVVDRGGQGERLVRTRDLGKEPVRCPQVVVPLSLASGESVTDQFVWDTAAAKVPPGTYPLTVTFLSSSTDPPPTLQFSVQLAVNLTDLDGHWAAGNVRQGIGAGFVDGYPDQSFRPDATVTRAELIKMLVRARGLTGLQRSVPSFTDVAGHWVESQGYLEAAVEAEILHPEDYGGVLKPDEPVNRQETTNLVVRAMGFERAALMPPNYDTIPFTDKDRLSQWVAGFVSIAAANHIVSGYPDGTFRPDAPVSRAEAVTMVLRMQEAVAVEPREAAFQFGEQRTPVTVLVMKHFTSALAPLPEVAAAVGIDVTPAEDGWVLLTREDRSVRVKAGVPALVDQSGKQWWAMPPLMREGKLYVPDLVFLLLNRAGYWDDVRNAFYFPVM